MSAVHVVGVLLLGIFVSFVSDLPRVLSMPVRLYLPKGMMGRIECQIEANPPVTLVVWSKNEQVIDVAHSTRLKTNKEGALVIKAVSSNDEGRYACTPYSPMGVGKSSTPVQVLVRGQCPLFTYCT